MIASSRENAWQLLAYLDGVKYWSLSARACTIVVGWRPMVKARVRRKKGESLGGMLARCCELAQERVEKGWTPPSTWGECAGCGARSRLVRVRAVKLDLCTVCRGGLR